jgi:aromatic-amino-acid transaminase
VHSPFNSLTELPADPIFGVTEAFKADTKANKINLAVGVYLDESGKLARFPSIQKAEQAHSSKAEPKAYLPIDGLPEFNRAVQKLVLGSSWENHQALFSKAGFSVLPYPYYDPKTFGINFQGMLDALSTAKAGDIVLLHASCHNPTGLDLDAAQWQHILRICIERQLTPFFDFAYQGFGQGVEEDAQALRSFAAAGLPCVIANSFSKSCSLYGERVGGLTVTTTGKDESKRVLSQLKRIVRTNYSNPPSWGAKLVTAVLEDSVLQAEWRTELDAVRQRIRSLRSLFVAGLVEAGVDRDFSFVEKQSGMFSYTGIAAPEVLRLRAEHGLYMLETGRVCIAALNRSNVEPVCAAIAAVLK